MRRSDLFAVLEIELLDDIASLLIKDNFCRSVNAVILTILPVIQFCNMAGMGSPADSGWQATFSMRLP